MKGSCTLRSTFSEYGNICKIKDNKLTWRRIIDEFLSRFLHFQKSDNTLHQ